jgi:isoleucyl-tRNA synthetase
LPLLSETVYRGLTGEPSVHLTDWPDAARLPLDAALVQQMDRVRDACSVGLSLRESKKLRTRLPLGAVIVAGGAAASLRGCEHLLRDELNVKHVEFAERSGAFTLLPGGKVELAGVVLEAGEFELKLQPKEGVACAALSTNDAVVVLDTVVTPELEQEGIARDFVRLVQQARKDAGLHVSDRIAVSVAADAMVASALIAHQSYIQEQVLAVAFDCVALAEGATAVVGKVGSGAGAEVRFALRKA